MEQHDLAFNYRPDPYDYSAMGSKFGGLNLSNGYDVKGYDVKGFNYVDEGDW